MKNRIAFVFICLITIIFSSSSVIITQARTSSRASTRTPSGIATQAYSVTQPTSTTVRINARISYASSAAPLSKINVYLQSSTSSHTVKLSIAATKDTYVFNLSYNEKSLNPGETYKIIAQVGTASEQLWTSGISKNTILGRLNTYSNRLYYSRDQTKIEQLTIKHLLQTALEPAGSTLYVWGGGWNKADTGAGDEAVAMGTSPQWLTFFNANDGTYDYRNTRYQIHDGLDCSGFIGWTIYNTVNTQNNKDGYVMLSQQMSSNFASRGWGAFTKNDRVTNYKPGDIMSTSGHVYMVLGVASDKSLVVIHSKPNGGVQINGTPTPSGNVNSIAVQLATYYMSKYYPAWYSKFPAPLITEYSFLTDYSQMRWNVTGNALLIDPDGISSKNAEQVLLNLLGN